jgi:hypothetical protein
VLRVLLETRDQHPSVGQGWVLPEVPEIIRVEQQFARGMERIPLAGSDGCRWTLAKSIGAKASLVGLKSRGRANSR